MSSSSNSQMIGRSRSRKKTSLACNVCRRQKVRCTGPPPPCHYCASRGKDCEFDESSDQRNTENSQRALEESDSTLENYRFIVNSLRSEDDGLVNQVVEAVRRDAGINQLVDTIKNYSQTDVLEASGSNTTSSSTAHARRSQMQHEEEEYIMEEEEN
ncbi:hypothetical protein TWF694_010095 [Orbilia ellipsospora]|uniref:Zn(2)-C6 fungal-type domain-containing protein n=1 Tax=Orbilia ellipsospora TaxID=2528407 RepID=A0AAV9XBH1_9PEZI